MFKVVIRKKKNRDIWGKNHREPKQIIPEKRTKKTAVKSGRFSYGKIVEWGILGLIVWSPLAAGSVYEWTKLVLQLVVLVMMGAYVLMQDKPRVNGLLITTLKWPKILFYGFFIFLFIQILPLPAFLVKLLSPNTYAMREAYEIGFSGGKFMSLSLIPWQTLKAGLEFGTYFLFGFLIIKTVTRKRQILRIFYVLVAMGAFEAFYGLLELYNANPRILFYKKVFGLDSVTGTFVNRNHFSGYLEMIIPLAIGLVAAKIGVFSWVGMKWRERVQQLSDKGMVSNIVIACGIILMSWAILFSKSRSGVFLLIFTFILFFELVILYFGMKQFQQRWLKNFLKITFLIITFAALYTGIDATIERFALDNLLQQNRSLYWSNTTSISADFPVTGSGLGTFEALYPAYEEARTSSHLSHAHNDYLEYLSELGWVGLGLLLGGIVLVMFYCFLIWRDRNWALVKGLAAGGLIAVVAILIHSITDFNLHIPANMLLFATVLSITVVVVFYRAKAVKCEGKEKSGKREMLNVKCEGKEKSGKREMLNVKCEGEEKSGKREMLNVKCEGKEKMKGINLKSEKRKAGRVIILVILVLAGMLDVIIFSNEALYLRATKQAGNRQKVRLLQRAGGIYPGNDKVFSQLGRSYFAMAMAEENNTEQMGKYLQASTRNFARALQINPVNRFNHFDYAQAVRYLELLPGKARKGKASWLQEYRKAAQLAGHNNQIYFEVGRVMLEYWTELSEKEQEFAVGILQNIIREKDREKFRSLMYVWELNIKDHEVIEKLIPVDEAIYRMYAEFLGGKFIFPDKRREYLVKAEALQYERAKKEYNRGDSAYVYGRIDDAFTHFKNFLNISGGIKFYQALDGNALIDREEYSRFKKSAYLKMAKALLEGGKELIEAEKYLRLYLELEQGIGNVLELETYLIRYGLIKEKLETSFSDLKKLAFHVLLKFKLNNYQEIVRVGNSLRESFVVVPEEKKKDYVKVLQIIGRSYQKIGYIYEAGDFLRKALEIDPDNLQTLLGLRANYDRLVRKEALAEVDERISEFTSSGVVQAKQVRIGKGQDFKRKLTHAGGNIKMDLHIGAGKGPVVPLVTVIFNGRVVFEDFVEDNVISLMLEAEQGGNVLVVSPVNCGIEITGLEIMGKSVNREL